MRTVLLATAMLALAFSVALAFPYTNWTGRRRAAGVPDPATDAFRIRGTGTL